MPVAHINRIGTAVPRFDVHRKFLEFAPGLLPCARDRRLFRRMAERSGIEHRYSFFEPDPDPDAVDRGGFFRRGAFPDTAARMRFYEEHAGDLAEAAVRAMGGGEAVRGVTHVIVTTCTGFHAPGIDHALVARLGLARSVERTVVGFMGCHAAISALKLARHVVRSEPASRVLVLSLELCTLHLQESAVLEQVLSFLVFGDGCSACLVSAEPDGIAIEGFRTEVIPGSAGEITWRIGRHGFDMHLSGTVPRRLAAGLPAAFPAMLGGRGPGEVELWAVHPGGRSVLDAVEQAAALEAGRLADSRAVLRDCGNMSSPSVVFVLARMLRRFRRTGIGGNGLGCALAFGPGLTAEGMLFRMA
jgi:alpha-pyrone synthase